jgi:putative addiction module component (TIGR02574 family)
VIWHVSLLLEEDFVHSTAEDLESAVLQLPREQRARLAERLIASLDEDAAVERAWAAEIRRRVDELHSGRVQTIPGEQVFEELKDLFR